MNKCPICSREATVIQKDNDGPFTVHCARCSDYIISASAVKYWEKNKNQGNIKKLSYWLQNRRNKLDPIDIINLRTLPESIELPKPREQADNLLLWIGSNSKEYNSEVVEALELLTSVIGSNSEDEVKWIADYLKDEKYIKHMGFQVTQYDGKRYPPKDQLKVVMTFKGWDRYYELSKPKFASKLCFIAMQYNDAQLERFYSEQIVKTVKETGFEIKLLREILKAGSIDDQLCVQIRRAKFLLVDLTHDNEGAYWEAGFAEGLGKPVIYLCEKEKFDNLKTHFDTNHLTTVTGGESTIEDDMKNLKAIIKNTFPDEVKLEG